MMLHNLSPHVLTKRLKVDGTNWTGAAGTTDLSSDIIDMLGFYGVRFIVGFGAITSGAVTSFKIRQGNDAALSDAADIAGGNQTIVDTGDNKIYITEIFRPYERYLQLVTDRGTQNAVVDFLIVELFAPSDVPVAQDATVGGYEFFNGSAEGTA